MNWGIIAALGLLFTFNTVNGQLDPEIVDEIIPEITSQGGEAKLNCTVVNKQSGHTVHWTFMDSYAGGDIISNDKDIFITNPECKEGKKKYEVIVNKFNQRETYMLKINCLEFVDYGYYKCYIQIRGDSSASWPSKIGYLVVQVPPTITSKNVAVKQLDEGQSGFLQCEATGVPKPNITWVRSDGGMLPGGMGALWNSTILPLNNITKDNRGLYKCVADNQVRPPDVYLVALQVFFKPETKAVQDTVGQAQNRQFDAKLECRIATTTLRFQESWYTLRIKNVEANDYTKYFCIAQNRIGRNATTMITLFETMECQGANCPTYEGLGASAISVSLLATISVVTLAKLLL
ncbi:LACH-like protein [Mya arenaria]|uniref:LACH-like protein n=1 Tax=Mya arenaria TaxID=6604 RepID=A0ABY7EB81_MYAAR|nr:LACH-like protein [Mya arenaria]